VSNRFKALFIAPDFTRQSNFDVPDRLKPGLERGAPAARVGVPVLADPLVLDHFVSDRLKPGLQRACELAGTVGIALCANHLINMFRMELPRDDS
jgi:hypothetical protein